MLRKERKVGSQNAQLKPKKARNVNKKKVFRGWNMIVQPHQEEMSNKKE